MLSLYRQEPCGSSTVSFCQSSPDSLLPSLKTMKVQHKDRLNVRTLSDRQECYITAMDITHDGRILLADSGNSSIKLFNTDGQHLSPLVLAKMFSDISAMSNEVAVIAFVTETPLLCLDIKGRIKKRTKHGRHIKGHVCIMLSKQNCCSVLGGTIFCQTYRCKWTYLLVEKLDR